MGGYGTSINIPKKIKNEKFPNKKLSLIVHVESKDTIFGNFNAYNVTLSNLTNKEINFSAQDSRLYMKVQGKDEDGIWKDIEYLPNRRLCKLTGDEFDTVRQFFSEKNQNAFFIKKRCPIQSDMTADIILGSCPEDPRPFRQAQPPNRGLPHPRYGRA